MNLLREYIREILNDSIPVGAIYCDMDGVLVDFEAGAIALVNETLLAAREPGWTSTSKSIRSSVRRVWRELGEGYLLSPGDDLRANKGIKNLSYSLIGKDPGTFFRSLPPFEDGVRLLWPFLNSLGVPVHILSAPISGVGPGGSAEDGKRDWAKILTPQPASVIIASAVEKHMYAMDMSTGKPNVLVDDKESTVSAWNSPESGGDPYGILHFPGDSMSTIQRLQRLGL